MAEPKYEDCVFLNLPFAPEYEGILHAIVFTVQDCGFVPRCALEGFDSGDIRIEKIFALIEESKFGIHDISYTQLDPTSGLPRFNMPLELGIFMGATHYGVAVQKKKQYLILDNERYRYQVFCSDISGQDIREHGGKIEGAIKAVRYWLSHKRPKYRYPTWQKIQKRYLSFVAELPIYAQALEQDPEDLTFNDYSSIVSDWLHLNSWGSRAK
jgi:hypothetical protein